MFNKSDKNAKGKSTLGNSASLIDLKAELYRKKQEANLNQLNRKAKPLDASDEYAHARQTGKDVSGARWNLKAMRIEETIRSKVTRKQDQRNRVNLPETRSDSSDGEEEEEEEELRRALQLSKQRLEEKSREYEQKKKDALDNILNNKETVEDDRVLVNFDDKVLFEHRNGIAAEQSGSGRSAVPPSDDLVEYVDSFGRVRKCRPEEVQRLREMDEDLAIQRVLTTDLNQLEQYGLDELAQKMSREEEQQEEQQQREEGTEAITYQRVSRHEVRQHGTSYLQFSTSLEERQRQMESLEDTRTKLQSDIEKNQRVKERQESEIRDRLARIARRRGLIAEDEGASCSFIDKYAGSNETEERAEKQAAEVEDLKQEIKAEQVQSLKRRMTKMREWDDGKDGVRFVPSSDNKRVKQDSDNDESNKSREDSESDEEIDKFLSDTFASASRKTK
jgi:hypothetical protein